MNPGPREGENPGPGWHPDPHGKASLRYWDGTRWTQHVSEDPAASQAPSVLGGGSSQHGGSGWLNRNWPWIVAAVAGLIVGVAAGGGGDTSKSTPEARTVTETQTETQTETERKVKTVQQEQAPTPSRAPSTGGESYSGSGEKNLGTIDVATESVLSWRNSGSVFNISNDFNDANTIDATSQAHSGETTVAAGTYHKVHVIADGDWSFTLRPK